jgi:hypothetical protein
LQHEKIVLKWAPELCPQAILNIPFPAKWFSVSTCVWHPWERQGFVYKELHCTVINLILQINSI